MKPTKKSKAKANAANHKLEHLKLLVTIQSLEVRRKNIISTMATLQSEAVAERVDNHRLSGFGNHEIERLEKIITLTDELMHVDSSISYMYKDLKRFTTPPLPGH